jgi:hypothetical protein
MKYLFHYLLTILTGQLTFRDYFLDVSWLAQLADSARATEQTSFLGNWGKSDLRSVVFCR